MSSWWETFTKMTYRTNKNRNLCQVGTLCQSQELMPQVAIGFVYFVFMFLKLIYVQNIICTGPFISVGSEEQ